MTPTRGQIAALLAAGAVTAAAIVGGAAATTGPSERTAVVIDASAARDGRDLVHPSLRSVDAEVRLPRSSREAETDVRYFAEQGYRIVVAGPASTAAAQTAGVPAESTTGLHGALAVVAD
jgi:hypothetical protein